jgi:hypothetical protein
MKYRRFLLMLALVLALNVTAYSAYQLSTAGTSMTSSAQAYLKTLDKEQHAISQLDYDTPQRVAWHFIPKDERKGLQIKHMNEPQRKAAYKLLSDSLSEVGYDKSRKIMALEAVLAELEKDRKGGNIRDSQRYYVTIFGQPSAESRWGLSFEGHHLSLNFVVEKNKVISSTPAFFAANPSKLMSDGPMGLKKGMEVLGAEENLAFELVNTLNDDQQSTAVIAKKAPREIRAAGEAQPPQTDAEGIAASQLNKSQQKLLKKLIGVYADAMPAQVKRDRLTKIEQAGFDKVYFAWAGAKKPGIGHYYRVQGPSFLIEFVNTQPDVAGNPASHIHCVWRDLAGDFALAAK